MHSTAATDLNKHMHKWRMVMDGPKAQNCLFIGLFRRNAVPARQWDNITPLFYYNKPLADDYDCFGIDDICSY